MSTTLEQLETVVYEDRGKLHDLNIVVHGMDGMNGLCAQSREMRTVTGQNTEEIGKLQAYSGDHEKRISKAEATVKSHEEELFFVRSAKVWVPVLVSTNVAVVGAVIGGMIWLFNALGHHV